MKILHLINTSTFSGAEKVARDIIINLNKSFPSIYVCTGSQLADKIRKSGIITYVIPDFSNNKLLLKSPELIDIIKKEKIDIIHAHNITSSIKAYLVANKLNIPIISHIHNSYKWLRFINLKKILDMYFRNKFILSIACSKYVKNYYLKYNPLADKKKIISLSNSIILSEIPKTFNNVLNENCIKLLYIGRIVQQKRLDIMLKAINIVKKKNRNIKLYIIGEGPDQSKIYKLIVHYNLTDFVCLLGKKENVYDYYHQSDIFLLSSDYEGLPIVLLEAMAMRKLIITTSVAGITELIKNKETGFLVKKQDYKKFAETIIDVIDNLDFYKKKIGENAYKFVKNNFSMNNYIRKLEKIYFTIYQKHYLK